MNWKTLLAGLVIGALAVALGGYLYFQLGFAPVAVNSAPMPFEKQMARIGLSEATKGAMKDSSPEAPTEANLLAGARVYRTACAECHGLPNVRRTSIAANMAPPPPSLLAGKGVTDDPVGRTHWVVANGIRMTGMPGFKNIFPDDQLWDVSQLLAHANALPATVQQLLEQPDAVPVEAAKQ